MYLQLCKSNSSDGWKLSLEYKSGGGDGHRLPVPPFEEMNSDFPNNDFGNSQWLIKQHGDDMMFVFGLGWFVWDGRRWARDYGELLSIKKAHEVAGKIRQEADSIDVDALAERLADKLGLTGRKAKEQAFQRKAALLKWGIVSGNQNRAKAMLEASKSYLSVDVSELDSNDYLLCLENGTLELRAEGMEDKGFIRFREHRREDRITCLANVEYNPDATCPEWKAFLTQVLPDEEVRLYQQRYCGSMLTGDTSEQCMQMLHGDGANGKSVFMEVLARIFGENAMSLPIASLIKNTRKGGGDASPDLARLRSARFVRTSEPEVGAPLSTSSVKQFTGGEPILVRENYGHFFELYPKFKLMMACNSLPSITGGDHGIWRRIKVIPFNVRITEANMDPHLTEKLLKNPSGLLNWALDGLRMWYDKEGLCPPDKVAYATSEYKDEQDLISIFIRDCIASCEGHNVQATKLYSAYCDWCMKNSFDADSQSMFGRLATERGLIKRKIGVMKYLDIRLNAPF